MIKLFSFVAIISISIVSTNCYGEQYWSKTYRLPYDGVINKDAKESTGGGYVLSGYIFDPATSYWADALVFKVDTLGDIVWSKTFDCVGDDDAAYYVHPTSDGGCVVAGSSYTFWVEYDWLILKLDEMGNRQWHLHYDRGPMDFVHAIQETSDEGYIMWGYTDDHLLGRVLCVLKLNNGNTSWTKMYADSHNRNFTPKDSVYETKDEGYVFMGTTTFFGSGSNDYLVLKLNTTGDILWQKTYGGEDDDVCSSIKPTTDGGYIVAGYTESFGAGGSDGWVLKLDNSGNIVWQKTYGGNNNDDFRSVYQTTDGGYIVAGYTESFGAGDTDGWVLKLAKNGNVVWQKTYGGNNNDDINSIYQTSDGGYIAAGTITTDWENDLTLLKLDSNGEIPNCTIIGTSNASVSNTLVVGLASTIIPQEINLSNDNDSLGSHESSIEVSAICCYDADDYDCDSIPNSEDNCPETLNTDQEDTYPPGGNGIGDACECEGDFDCDKDCDGSDAFDFKVDFGRSLLGNPCESDNPCNGDFDCDNDCDGSDAFTFKKDFGRSPFNNCCPACVVGEWCVYNFEGCVEDCETALDLCLSGCAELPPGSGDICNDNCIFDYQYNCIPSCRTGEQ